MDVPEAKDSVETAENSEEQSKEEIQKKTLDDYVSELQTRLKYKADLRQENIQCVRPPESHFSKLDSSLKKNTTFVKKLKTFSAGQLDVLLKDFGSLNLTKYISEVASAITEAKLKLSDIQSAIKLCSKVHQIYSEFALSLFENWQKLLTFKVSDKISNPSKLRVDLRFYGELITCGIFTNKMGLPLLGNVLSVLINMDKEEHNNINILVTFCRHCGEDYAGLVPKKIKDLAEEYKVEIPRSSFLPPEKQATVRTILMDYYSSLVKHLGAQKQQLQALHLANQRTLHTRGELSQERKDQLEAQQGSYDRLLVGAQNFAEILGEDLGEVGEPIAITSSVTNSNSGDLIVGCGDDEIKLPANDPWQDEDTKSFYTSLPDVKVFLPNYQPPKEANPETELSEEILDQDLQEEEFNDAEDPEQEPEQEEPQATNVSNKYALEAFLTHLPNCVNRELIDNSAVDFILNLNTKHNRKKITRVLFSVARTRLDLLPFYARFAAILHPVLPDIGTDLSQMLKQDFKYHVRKKDQINIESKIKVVRFIGELVKFGLYSKIEALYCLKVLLHDFKHHHVEMACNLLETCGRFLYCSPDTHQRTAVYLQQMMRIKAASITDSRHITQIENAYYYVNPPESTAVAKEEEIPLHRFIQKILHQDLQKSSEDKTLRLMRKIDWDNEELSQLIVQWLAAGWRVKHSGRRCLARLVAALASWQEMIGSRVVDAVLEDLRVTLEHPHPRHNQRRIAMARYLGEMYNYKLVDSRDIFNALYSFITFGVTMDHSIESPLDPPDSAFRIRLVCVLLETCGAYFNSGSSKKKLDYFLVFFQNYYWYKQTDPIWTEESPFPIYIKNIYQECLQSLRPKLVYFNSWQECKDAIDNLKKDLYPHLNEEGNLGDENVAQGEDDGLETIMETDDECVSDHQVVSDSSDDEDVTEADDLVNSVSGVSIQSQGDIQRAPAVLKQVEDVEFESALEKMMLDNISDRQREGRSLQRDISVPVHCRQQTKKTYEQLLQGNDSVEFVLMVRKGTKQTYKSFDAPAELATNLKQQALANRLEMEKVKRLTLNITERQEEEDYCGDSGGGGTSGGGGGGGGGGGSSGSGNPNRGPHSRQKYQHPKGAPDVDLIFGTKKLK